jgi:hypothetical protein
MFATMRRRPQSDFDAAMTLMEIGRSDGEIARLTGIPRATVRAWRHGLGSRVHRRIASATPAWRPTSPRPYSYLLGVYLGDGCISLPSPASACLVIALDSRYPGIVADVETAIMRVLPDTPTRRYLRMDGSTTVIQAHHPALPFAFPQHGPGRKHLRRIVLAAWQRELTARYPRELLRGLIHSDGCRTVNRFQTKLPSGRVAQYEYPRYFFSNLSADIRGIFCDHCELLGIRWTLSNPRNISISHRRSVAVLDDFIGPKT